MKKKLLIPALMLLLYACNTTPSYIIKGSAAQPNMEGAQVRLQKTTDDGLVILDSTVVKDGAYTFKGTVQQPEHAYIYILSGKEWLANVELILENSKITVTSDSLGNRISGSPHNDLLQGNEDMVNQSLAKRNKAYEALYAFSAAGNNDQAMADSLRAEYRRYNDEVLMITLGFVKTNINNIAGQSQLSKISTLPIDKLKEAVSGATSEMLNIPAVHAMVQRIDALEKTTIGQPFVDLHMLDPDGKEIAISDYAGKGKYVFIDFWASWCGPCRHEMPYVVAAYKKYKNKGFEVVGISFDSKKEAWIKGIQSLGMEWPQMSDLQGWDSKGSTLYAITGIPHTVLLDKNGIIVAKNLRGEKLEEKLKEIYGR